MKKVIIDIKNKNDLENIDDQILNAIYDKKYPILRGLPFCSSNIEHNHNLFFGKGSGTKPKLCSKCKLVNWCDYNMQDFEISPITDPDKDLLEFLEKRDENIDDWI